MASEHPVFRPPRNREIRIWRYMDFAKYASMLANGGLFFAGADKLGDPFEGSYARANEPYRLASEIPPDAQRGMSDFSRRVRSWTFISCWHMNDNESAAMWNAYAGADRAIAVQSTFQRLWDSLDAYEQLYVGEVSYIDYDSEPIPEGNTFYPFVHKRRSFEHERELRAVIQDLPTTESGAYDPSATHPPGVWRPVNLDDFVEAVFVSPGSPKWFVDLVRSVSDKYGLAANIRQSELDKEAFF